VPNGRPTGWQNRATTSAADTIYNTIYNIRYTAFLDRMSWILPLLLRCFGRQKMFSDLQSWQINWWGSATWRMSDEVLGILFYPANS